MVDETMKLTLIGLVAGIVAVLIVVAINFFVLYLLNFPSMATDLIRKYFILLQKSFLFIIFLLLLYFISFLSIASGYLNIFI